MQAIRDPQTRVLMGRVFLVVRIKGRAVSSQVGRTTGSNHLVYTSTESRTTARSSPGERERENTSD